MRRDRNLPVYASMIGFGLLGLVFLLFIAILLLYSGISFGGKKVAVITIDGPITTQSTPASLFEEGKAGSEDIAKTIRSLNKRDDVGAVVVVINSPGGSVVASREIYAALKDLKKPKVAYLREIATSGGYYVACGTDYIVSDPDTITGSIGVIAIFTDASSLLSNLGVNITAIKSGKNKDIGAFYAKLSDRQKKLLQNVVDEIFKEFVQVVESARKGKLDKARFNEILDARFVTGREAKRIGLVDQLGSKQDAINIAAKLAGIKGKPEIVKIKVSPADESPFGIRSWFAGIFHFSPSTSPRLEVRYE